MPKPPLSPEDMDRLAKLAAMPDEDIDLEDIPEATDFSWKYARRPNQGQALVRPAAIEAKLYAWFARAFDDPETAMNDVLRRHIAETDAKSRKKRA